jgi:hypothetical protein
MSAVIELITLLQDRWAVLVGIFGISLGAVKFWLRDAESESIRIRFMQVWDYLDDAKRYNFYQLRTHRFTQRILTAVAIVMLFIANLLSFLIELPNLVERDQLDNFLFVVILVSIVLLSMAPAFCIYYYAQDKLKSYVDAALSQEYIIDTVARLIVPPSLIILLKSIGFNALILGLYGLVFGYLLSMGVVVVIFMLVYLPVRLSILFLERLLIRLIEIKDGPIYSVAAVCAIVGFSIKVVFY